jgi:cysteinyl-tRNA synthetase
MIDPSSSELQVYNTLTRQVDKFESLKPGRVNMFVCGPTVYDTSHIGHAKTYVAYDIMARYLKRKGYSVFFILNITDIDDKIIRRAEETSENPLSLSEHYAQAFYKDMRELHVNTVSLYAKASDYVPEIIEQVEGLIRKGLAYKLDGDVYFDISRFSEYGKLSRQKLDELTVHRVDPDPRKRNPGDFVLWKSQKPGEIAWESPWGKGRPGWHVEDTAITLTYFGATYDLHGGGEELIFPHHEAEIAQAEGLTGKKPLARYWLHTGLLSIKGEEMHKSLGNFIPIQDVLLRIGVDALRIFYASTHYRSPLDFTEGSLVQAESLARRFRRAYDQLAVMAGKNQAAEAVNNKLLRELEVARDEFFRAMDDDFNTPRALTAYVKMVVLAEEQTRASTPGFARLVLETLQDLGSILGVLEAESLSEARFSELANLMLELRGELRAKREYALSDRIRDRMTKLGIVVEDTS